VLKKLDEDRDGRVSETDYHAAVTKENLLLEAFGQCLPLLKVWTGDNSNLMQAFDLTLVL
jgi:hypothetical protein